MTTFTTGAGDAFAPNVQHFAPGDIIPDALVLRTSTFTVPVEGDAVVVQVPFIDADADAGFVAEGDAIPEAAPESSAVSIATGKVAVLGKISAEAWYHNQVGSLLSDSFRRAVIKKANTAYLNQAAPTAPAITPPAGLLNLSPTDGGTVAADLDSIVDAVAGIEAAYGTASHIIAHPDAWASIMKLKAGTGSNQSLVGAGTETATRALLSTPVLTSGAMPPGTLLVVDQGSILSAYGPLQVATSEHAYFGSDSVALRVTWRFGAKIVDTDRVVSLTIDE